jgi:ribosomal peptide maturation radical SAM protein 1
MRYFRSLLPRLESLPVQFSWEVKANLTREQVAVLRQAGVRAIQPGIEALSDHVLRLMRKGTTMFRNVQLLKWCRELGVTPYWNLLYGFPGETAEDYEESVETMLALWHLDPPTACGPIRLDRFSPYHADPEAFGMTRVRPMEPFRFLYPYGEAALRDIAYYFEFDYADGRAADAYARDAIALAAAWRDADHRGDLRLTVRSDTTLQLLDTRGGYALRPRRAVLDGWKAAVYAACDTATSMDRLREVPVVAVQGIGDEELRAFLDKCVQNRLMVTSGRSWLSVAVWSDYDRQRWPGQEAPTRSRPRRDLPLVSSVATSG